MTEANDQPTPFDQDLFDQTMDAKFSYFAHDPESQSLYDAGYQGAAGHAARLAAERQAAPVPSDEELTRLFFDSSGIGGWMIDLWPFDESRMTKHEGENWAEYDKKKNEDRARLRTKLIAGIRAVREALTAPGNALEVPGNVDKVIVYLLTGAHPSGYVDDDGQSIPDYSNQYGGGGPTWQEALAAAIAQSNEENTNGHN